jgi:cytochrome c-type biogenesis protein CcmH
MKKSHLAGLLVLAALIASPPANAASQAAPRASLPDIEDEVMCQTCQVPLNLAFSPQAERERAFIRAEIARGRTKEQIKQALVAEYGPSVLALPDTDEGINWAVYLVPIVGAAAAGVALLLALRRWRRDGGEPAPLEATPELSPAESARLERDLARYDD